MGQLKGKQLLPVLCGRTVTSDSTDLDRMAHICRQHQIECWDMGGSGVGRSSGSCFQSPYVHPVGKNRGIATAAACQANAGTRAGAAGSVLRNAVQQFAPLGRVMLSQLTRGRLL